MSYDRPLGVKLIGILLLLSAVGSVVAAFGYWYTLVNPSIFIFYRISDLFGMLLGIVGSSTSLWESVFPYIVLQFVSRIVNFQLAIGLFQAHVVFYLILSVALGVLSVGLFRMKNWARVTTVVYAILTLISTFLFVYLIFPTSNFNYSLFNINIPMVLLSPAGLALFQIILTGLLVSIIMVTLILVYLLGNVQYEFQ